MTAKSFRIILRRVTIRESVIPCYPTDDVSVWLVINSSQPPTCFIFARLLLVQQILIIKYRVPLITDNTVDNRHTIGYYAIMKYFDWNNGKNERLKKERNVSFEEVLLAIEKNRLLAVLEHPNRQKYPSQQIYIVEIEGYAYIVPFIETEETVFLKTIIPSRKMTKIYLTGDLKWKK